MADTGPDRVLVPTLGRPREDEALAYALETFPDAGITLLAVVTPLDAPLSEGGVLERDAERTAAARASATELLESVADADAADRVRIETADGRPANGVPRNAATAGVDHVVMAGSVGRNGFLGRFLGRGIAATVVERTPEPVTVLD
jgi:nucleotide-binding universal stress UspA family protein